MSRQLCIVLARDDEVVDKDSFDSGRDNLVLCVVPKDEVDCAQFAHVEHRHDIEVLVEEDELEQGSDD